MNPKVPMTTGEAAMLFPDREEELMFNLGATCSVLCTDCQGRNVFPGDYRGVPREWNCVYCGTMIGNYPLINLMNGY